MGYIGNSTQPKQWDVYDKTDVNGIVAGLDTSLKEYVDNKLVDFSSDVYTGAYGVVFADDTMPVCQRIGASGYTAIQSLMKRCVLNADGSVRYYLDANDSTKKADGTNAVLDGTDGNVMVEIPKVYHKYEYNAGVHKHMIALEPLDGYEVHWAFMHPTEKAYRYYPAYLGYSSGGKLISRSGVYPTVNQTITQFRTLATANGAGWHQIDFALYELITLFMIIEYGTMDIQTALGQGRTMLTGGTWANGSLIGINGLSNKLGNGSGSYTYAGSADDAQADYSYMSYRGCENFFGNIWRFVDGINATGSNAKVIYTNNNPATYASDVFTGDYTSTGVTTASANGYVSALGNSKKGFIPTSITGGASNKGTTDYYSTSTVVNTIALVGGCAFDALFAGPLYLLVDSAASLSSVNVGAGVSR